MEDSERIMLAVLDQYGTRSRLEEAEKLLKRRLVAVRPAIDPQREPRVARETVRVLPAARRRLALRRGRRPDELPEKKKTPRSPGGSARRSSRSTSTGSPRPPSRRLR